MHEPPEALLQVGLGQSQQPRINTFNQADLLEQLAGVSFKRLDGVHPVDFRLSQVKGGEGQKTFAERLAILLRHHP